MKSIGANNNKQDKLALGFDDGDEHRSRRGPPSWHAMPESDTKGQQQHLSLPSPEDRTPWSGLVGLMAKGTLRLPRATKTIILPMSFSDALNQANPAEEAKKAREGDMPCTQTITASQPRKMDEEDKEGERVQLRRSTLGDHESRHVSRVRGLTGDSRSVRRCRCHGAREYVVVDAAEMVVRTRTPFASNFFDFRFPYLSMLTITVTVTNLFHCSGAV